MSNAATAAQTKESPMGDRANVFLVLDRDEDRGTATGLWLYTHYHGEDWAGMAKAAIVAARGRWGDEAYFNRVVITELFKDLTGDTGGGVSLNEQDNSYAIFVIDPGNEVYATVQRGAPEIVRNWEDTRPFESLVA